METKVDGLKINYEVSRSEKASRPRIDHKLGEFTVVIPENEDIEAEEIISRKKNWIAKKRKDFLRFERKIPEREFEEGGEIPVLGEKKKIIVEKAQTNKIDNNIILAEHLVGRNGIKNELEKILREKAREKIDSKIEEYSDSVDGDHDNIYIRDQETRWGSCSPKQNLSFNWRLILGPEHVLEYVVAHELAHLEEKSHNEEFWSIVREIYPNYKKSNKWLSENSSKLVFDKELIRSN